MSTDTMYIMYIMTCRNSGSGRRWLRICDRQHPCPRRDSGHGFSHNDFGVLLQCCDMFQSCPYTIPICDGWFYITIKVESCVFPQLMVLNSKITIVSSTNYYYHNRSNHHHYYTTTTTATTTTIIIIIIVILLLLL